MEPELPLTQRRYARILSDDCGASCQSITCPRTPRIISPWKCIPGHTSAVNTRPGIMQQLSMESNMGKLK